MKEFMGSFLQSRADGKADQGDEKQIKSRSLKSYHALFFVVLSAIVAVVGAVFFSDLVLLRFLL